MADENKKTKEYNFVQKVWIVGLIFSFIITILLIFEATFDIVILVLAGALIACYFRGLSGLIYRKTGWNQKLSLTLSVLVSFLIIGGISYLIGATVSEQASQIKNNFPVMVDNLKSNLENSDIGSVVLDQAQKITSSEKFRDFASRFFMTTFSGIANIYVVIILGIFFTVTPSVYINGIVQLVPPRNREKAQSLMAPPGLWLKKMAFWKVYSHAGCLYINCHWVSHSRYSYVVNISHYSRLIEFYSQLRSVGSHDSSGFGGAYH